MRLQNLVRRVVGRVLEPATGARSAASTHRTGGVHVLTEASGATKRPLESHVGGAPSHEPRGNGLISAEDLAGNADGSTFLVPAGARLTPLAREEAWRRGIRLHETGSAPGRGLRVAVGSDHGGFAIKEEVKVWLTQLGHSVVDLGTHDESAVDYPDFARAVAEAVAEGSVDFGVCVDGAGIGSAMAANKVPGVRAALCYDETTAKNAREHNFANVLSLGGPMLGADRCHRILRAFLSTPEGAARHERRVEKISAIESRYTGTHRPPRRVLSDPACG